MKTLAVVILTRNEEDNIVEVVQNAKQCTEEVLIIDSGSTDNTQALAEAQGARVCYHAWDGDFSAQRNFAIGVTEADWILYLDADERMRPEMVARIRQILQQDGMEKQYRMKRKSVSFGVTFQHGVLYPDRVLRMFPRTRAGRSGRKNSAAIRPFGRRMPIGTASGHRFLVFSPILWAAFARCSSQSSGSWMGCWEAICAAPIFFIRC